jgi:hypothetical protein
VLKSQQFVIPAKKTSVAANVTSHKRLFYKGETSCDTEVEKAAHSISKSENNSVAATVLSGRWMKCEGSLDLREHAGGRKRKRYCSIVEARQRSVNSLFQSMSLLFHKFVPLHTLYPNNSL